MTEAISKASSIERALIGGDLSHLGPDERVHYYQRVCESLGLNPMTKPFAYIQLNGKLQLYALKDCTEQLRSLKGISIESCQGQVVEGVYIVTATGRDKTGRADSATGAVPIEGLKGEAKANALMKAETKAKRRLTLSLAGLGMLDETETETIPGAVVVQEGAKKGPNAPVEPPKGLPVAQTPPPTPEAPTGQPEAKSDDVPEFAPELPEKPVPLDASLSSLEAVLRQQSNQAQAKNVWLTWKGLCADPVLKSKGLSLFGSIKMTLPQE